MEAKEHIKKLEEKIKEVEKEIEEGVGDYRREEYLKALNKKKEQLENKEK